MSDEDKDIRGTVDVEIIHGVRLNNTPYLWIYNKRLSLLDNIQKIVAHHNKEALEPIPANGIYSLKLIPQAKLINSTDEHYITADTLDNDIIAGYHIKLVQGVQETIRNLFKLTNPVNNELLLLLSYDQVVIEEIVHQEKIDDLISLIMTGKLSDDGESGALNIIFHLLKCGYLRHLDDSFAVKVVDIAQNDKCSSSFAISMLIHILRAKKEILLRNKALVIQYLKVPYIMRNLKTTATNNDMGFYHRVFCLLNALISCARLEKRSAILAELGTAENLCTFYDFLRSHRNLENFIAREVFVLQARLLTHKYVPLYTKTSTVPSIAEEGKRDSVTSVSSDYDYLESGDRTTTYDYGPWVSNLQRAESALSILSLTSVTKLSDYPLLNKCLEYGKNFYHTYFDSLEKSDYSCDAELYTIAQNIISLMTNLLCIGIRVHAHSYYLPVFFAPKETKTSTGIRTVEFFEELFVKTLIMLFRTKAEMRVKTKEDFAKLYQIVKRQLVLVFEKRPLDFEDWDMITSAISYSTLQEIQKIERDNRWRKIYTTNPCVRELIQEFTAQNLDIIAMTRYKVLQKGFVFKNMHQRSKHFSITLMSDLNSLLYKECTPLGTPINDGYRLCIPVASIKHIIYGENCNLRTTHIVSQDKSSCVFTISYEPLETTAKETIDCYFHKDGETMEDMATLAEYWKDGLNLLIGTSTYTSPRMEAELNELNEIDCKLQLIELQDVEIPMHAPTVPPFEISAYN